VAVIIHFFVLAGFSGRFFIFRLLKKCRGLDKGWLVDFFIPAEAVFVTGAHAS
jgi:hypothetical protein